MEKFTTDDVRAAYDAGGIAHAEMCLENAESQLGREACRAARAEWEHLARALAEG